MQVSEKIKLPHFSKEIKRTKTHYTQIMALKKEKLFPQKEKTFLNLKKQIFCFYNFLVFVSV